MANSNVQLADAIIENNLHRNTKKQYDGKIKHVNEWFQKHHPELCVRRLQNTELNLEEIATTSLGSTALKEFYAHISKKRNKDGTYKSPVVYQSFEHVSGYKSAIKNYFKSKRVRFSDESELTQSDFFGGYKRLIAGEKQDGTRKMREGKVPLSFSVYRFLAKLALSSDHDFSGAAFAHVFLVLCWNLIARCVSVASLMYNHITWKEDAMVIVFPTSKSDKEGKNCSPKHVYANVQYPEICPILSFAIFVFTSGVRRIGAKPTVFSDNFNNTEDRFSNWLKSICTIPANLAILVELGVDILEIGTHSFRKGVAEFLSGMVGGASPIAIYLRAGWSLGPVQSRYILEAQGGDQICGRAATGLDITTTDFASLPPHFNPNTNILSVEEWEEILPGYITFYPSTFRTVLSYLLASIVFHKDWLIRSLHNRHPLFNTPLWTSGILDRLASQVLAGNGRNSTSLLTATGIPPHILLANELAKVERKLEALRLDLMERLNQLPDEIKTVMLQNFQVNGALPITHSQVVTMISNLEQTILNAMQQQQVHFAAQSTSSSTLPSASEGRSGGGYRTWTWKNRFHYVPQDFNFPTENMSNMWHLWWDGKVVERIAPYRKLQPYDLDNKNFRNRFIKARKVMEFITHHCGKTSNEIASANSAQRVQYLQNAYVTIFALWYGATDSPDRLDRRSVRIIDDIFVILRAHEG